LTEKFLDQVGPVLGVDQAKKASDLAWAVGGSSDVAGLVKAL
jgi:hypothetical protein